MIHRKDNNDLVLMKGAEKLLSVKAISKLSKQEQEDLISYAWYFYAKDGNFLSQMSDVEREKKIAEIGIDISTIQEKKKADFLKDAEDAFYCSEEKMLKTYTNQIDRQRYVLQDISASFNQIKEADQIITIMSQRAIVLQETVALIRKGKVENDSRMSLFEIP
jgi:hypothetical protein